jgi:hypothetical protein
MSKFVGMTPFHPSLPHVKGCPIVSGALAYDDPETGVTHILVIHQAIYFDHLENNLISPMQLRMNNISLIVNAQNSFPLIPQMRHIASISLVKIVPFPFPSMAQSNISQHESPLQTNTTTPPAHIVMK